MAIKFGKRDVAAMVEAIDREYDSAEDAASAALDAALDIIKRKAKFTVVGQVATGKDGAIKVSDPRAEKIALGWYSTEKQALDDAMRLFYSTQTHETHRAWVLPIFNGSPSAYYIDRKRLGKAEEAADIETRERTLAERVLWIEDNPDTPPPEHWGVEPLKHRLTRCTTCLGVGKTPVLITDKEVSDATGN